MAITAQQQVNEAKARMVARASGNYDVPAGTIVSEQELAGVKVGDRVCVWSYHIYLCDEVAEVVEVTASQIVLRVNMLTVMDKPEGRWQRVNELRIKKSDGIQVGFNRSQRSEWGWRVGQSTRNKPVVIN